MATYQYFVKEADKLNLAYITFLRYLPAFDVELDGGLSDTSGSTYISIAVFFRQTPRYRARCPR